MVAKKAKDRKEAASDKKRKTESRYAEVAAAVIEVNRKALESLKDK